MLVEPLQYPFFQRALAAGILAGIACGIMGTLVVVKRMASVSGGLSHAAFGGVGLGYLLGFDPMLGATAFAVLTGTVLGMAYRYLQTSLDTLIAMLWSVGMAMGILFVSLAPGYAPDLMSYLFGSILFVPLHHIWLVLALDLVMVFTVWLLYKEIQAVVFDEQFAAVMGVPVQPIFQGLLVMTSLTVVTLIKVVGIILVIALLTIPAAIAAQWSRSLSRMMIMASVLGTACAISGIYLSYWLSSLWDLKAPTGPLIVLLAASLYGLSSLVQNLSRRPAVQGPRPE
ncbi:MAG: metal ABC transporter permease [Acidobacteriota bacterium]